MKRILFLAAGIILFAFPARPGIKPVKLTCEYLINPPVIDVPNPGLSWINLAENGERGQYQTAWEIRVAESKEALLSGNDLVWSSGKVVSGESVNIKYKGSPLKSCRQYWWQVRVWDRYGKVSEWSEPASWGTGFFDPTEWRALWIGAPWQGEEALPKPANPAAKMPAQLPPPAPFLRKEFIVAKKIKSAVAYTTGLGYFELYCNGNKVGNDVLVPNQTNYGKRPNLINENIPLPDNFREYRVMYLAYDLTESLKEGKNAIGAIPGNGFYNPAKYWCGAYGTPRFLFQLHIGYDDGSEDIIVSDNSWKAAKGPILMDMIYYGEHYDARLEMPGWSSPGFNDSSWEQAALRKAPEGRLKAHMAYPDRVMEVLDPIKIEKLEEGRYKIDFGQEISGWVHLKNISGESGRKIEIKYLHSYSPNGENTYIMKGGNPESYHPRFTWFVFREVEVINWPGELTPDRIKAEAVYTMTETTGKFSCSNKLLEDINRIWWRSQTDNMHGGIASDCPNRERSPYTGDGQVACVTVIHNFDARAFYRKWIDDIIGASNVETGYVPNGAPWQPGCGGGVAWGAAVSIMPWEFYLHYGDTNILRDSYEAMKGYVRYMLTWTDEDGIMFSQAVGKDGKPLRWLNLGDWAQPFELPPDNMVHTFYLWRCADLTSKTAAILGYKNESDYYAMLAEKTKTAFHKRFFNPEKGTYGPEGGNIFALKMGVPEEHKPRVIAALKADIEARDGHLDTGIFGTRFFFEVLADNGLNELAYGAMSKRTFPSYGYWLEQGSTTTWEHFEKPGSGNHPMFGGGLVWLYRKLAGMSSDPEQPGYRHIIFRPYPPEEITYAGYSNLTNYGEAGISWKKENGRFTMEINVPVGSQATVYVPAKSQKTVLESGKKPSERKGVKYEKVENGYAVYKVGSGKYSFESQY
ncbi:MAG: family 78 glycoside hydrolase catalytic domain [Bacteroidales bacterium]|nr:family 78 glycoside hydrolase catalytic domain [Bacteroidales bacterium]